MAITEKYVSSAGSGTGLGTDESNQLSWTAMWTLINVGAEAGSRFNLKGNVTATATDTATGDGSTTAPVVIRGYKTTIGDGYLSRAYGGALVSSNLPIVTYNAGFRYNGASADFIILQDLSIVGNVSNPVATLGVDNDIINCLVTNNSTNASAAGIFTSNSGCRVINCDVALAASGGDCCINVQGTNGLCIGNRCTATGATGIKCRSTNTVSHNTCYTCTTGIASDFATGTVYIFCNTIYNCSGDGIDIINSTTGRQCILGNMITDCGGYGIDFNTSTCHKTLGWNRYRDCALGNINGGGDWATATTIAAVTTDTGGASTDYVTPGSNFALIPGSPGVNTNLGYLTNIGSTGSIVMAGSRGMTGGF